MRFYFPLLAILLFLAGCDSPTQSNDTVAPSPQQDSERLVVGTTANYPPIVFQSKHRIIGIEADFAAELAKELNRELELVDMPWENLAGALQSGEVDVVMAGVSVTEKRKQLAAFTHPYMESGQMTLIRMADLGALGAPGDMKKAGRIIGVEKNTTGHRFAEQAYPEATIMTFDSAGAGTRALREKQIDYFIHDAPTIWLVTLNNSAAGMEDILALYYPLTREELAWAVNRDNTTLLESLNGALQKMQQDGRAQRIINKWIRSRVIVSPPERPVEF
jgi:ABC-type amino acid transport substrate-binding protein